MRRATLLMIMLGALAAAAPAGAKTPAFRDGSGVRVLTATKLDARQWNVHVSTSALQHPVDVRVLLPAGYAGHPQRRYPVLYLFHGTSGRAGDWTGAGHAEATTAKAPWIVVMPDEGYNGDGGGYFTDWYNGGRFGRPKWETYNIAQVVPWVDANLRTRANRGGRAIAGLSQGGFGSLSLAARHPDMFQSVSAFSGAAEIDGDAAAKAIMTGIIEGTTVGLDHVADADAMFGPRATNELNWQAHDPHTLAENLRGMDIRLWTGNGKQGPLDPVPNPGAGAIEAGVHVLTSLFHAHLQTLHIPSVYKDYGPGTHSWPYWARDLKELVGPLSRRFAHPPKNPVTVRYTSAGATWAQWGWSVRLTRAEAAFSTLSAANPGGFVLRGTGKATVLTPALFAPRAGLTVRIRDATGTHTGSAHAGKDGRLRVAVKLGAGTKAGTARVRITT